MKLEEAIREIKLWTEAYKEVRFLDFYDKRYLRAIDTVLAELDTRYNKGYQDGFKQAKFDCEMDKLDGRINNVR